MLQRILFLVGLIFSIAHVQADTYYVPHVAMSSAWETYLLADNLDPDTDQSFHLVLYNGEGTGTVVNHVYTVPAGEQLRLSLRSLAGPCGEIRCGTRAMRFRLGYNARADLGGGTAEFDLPTAGVRNGVFSLSNYADGLTWSGFALMNTSDETVTAWASIPVSGSGKIVETFMLEIPPKSRTVNYFEDAFGYPFESIPWVTVSCDTPCLAGITISGVENERLLFTPFKQGRGHWRQQDTADYGTVVGAVHADDTVDLDLQFVSAYLGSEYGYMRVVRSSDGLELYRRTAGWDHLGVKGMCTTPAPVSAKAATRVYAYGIDYTNMGSPSYFLARVDPSRGEVLWKQNLSPGGSIMDMHYGFYYQIRAAASETTVQVMMMNADSNAMDTYLLNKEDGTILETRMGTGNRSVPTTLVYDAEAELFRSIYSTYNDLTGTFSLVTFCSNAADSLSTCPSVLDMSEIMGSWTVAHVLVYGGAVDSGVMRMVISASTGIPSESFLKISGKSFTTMPTQLLIGRVNVTDFRPDMAETDITSFTATLRSRITMAETGFGTGLAFICDNGVYGRGTTMLQFSPDDQSLGVYDAARLPYEVMDCSSYHGKLLMSIVERNFQSSFVFKGEEKGNDYKVNLALEVSDFFSLMMELND